MATENQSRAPSLNEIKGEIADAGGFFTVTGRQR
jgi:hypothetical protein